MCSGTHSVLSISTCWANALVPCLVWSMSFCILLLRVCNALTCSWVVRNFPSNACWTFEAKASKRPSVTCQPPRVGQYANNSQSSITGRLHKFSKFFFGEGLLVADPWGSGLMRAGLPTAGGCAPMDITAPLSVPAGDAGETAAAAATPSAGSRDGEVATQCICHGHRDTPARATLRANAKRMEGHLAARGERTAHRVELG